MTQSIRAIYHDGNLHLLDPVDLQEGEEIQVMILSDRDRVLAALGDLVVQMPGNGEDVDEEALAHEIEEGFRGQLPLSESIIQERLEGP